MREVLFNTQYGYYMNREVLGPKGDFITSPEISQIFGELMGIWCVAVKNALPPSSKIRIVELGPGRGSLMVDMLRAWASFPDFKSSISIHLVEMSPSFRQIQAQRITNQPYPPTPPGMYLSHADH